MVAVHAGAQTFRAGGELPEIQWENPGAAPDASSDEVHAALDAAGWHRAVELAGTEVLLNIEVATAEEYGAFGQRMLTEGSVQNATVSFSDAGDYLLWVDHRRAAYKTMRLSGNLDADLARARAFYDGVLPPDAEPMSDESVRLAQVYQPKI